LPASACRPGPRRLAAEVNRQRALGRDVVADYAADKRRRRAERETRAASTFGAAARDFVEQYASKKVRRWKEQARLLGFRPAADGLEIIRGSLAERWAEWPIAAIDGHDIHALIDETRRSGAPGLERRAEGPTETRARAMLSCLSRMFRWLVQHRRAETNPCAGVHRPEASRARDRVLTDAEIVKFWTATDAAGEPFRAVLKLLLLTGCRLNEVAGMRRAELSDDGATWTIPGERTKNRRPHVVPLAPPAREVLANAGGTSEIVFTTTGQSPPSGWSKVKKRLDSAMGSPPAWRLHDLRRTTATGMAEIGVPPHIVEACLNHVSGAKASVAGVYNRAAYMPERRAALERWAAHVRGLVGRKSAGVIPLRKGA
jgi:integrase